MGTSSSTYRDGKAQKYRGLEDPDLQALLKQVFKTPDPEPKPKLPKSEKDKVEEAEIKQEEKEREYEKAKSENVFALQSEMFVKQNQLTLKLLTKSIEHVRKYDSLDTGLVIANKAYNHCPAMFNRRLIATATKSLKAAIKANKWMQSRKRKKHVDEHTVQKNLNTFYEKLAEAVASIKTDLDKNSKTLFKRITQEYESNLPVSITKPAIKRNAHIVAMCYSTPSKKYKFTRLESSLFLIENVTVLGIQQGNGDTFAKATKIAAKLGSTCYERKIVRPTLNVDWYIVQDFGTMIKFASFADRLDIPDGNGESYEDFLNNQERQKKLDQQVKSRRLAEFRTHFQEDNNSLLEEIKLVEIEIENLVAERSKFEEDFAALTAVGSETNKLLPTQINKLHNHSLDYRSHLMAYEGKSFLEANKMMVFQRVEARATHIEIKTLSERLRGLRQQLTFLKQQLDNRRTKYARNLGLIALNKPHAELDA